MMSGDEWRGESMSGMVSLSDVEWRDEPSLSRAGTTSMGLNSFALKMAQAKARIWR
jgi:hypothetical protein